MKSFFSSHRIVLVLLLCAALAGLAGCGGNVRPSAGEIASHGPFGMILQSYKSGQFIVDGGVVAPSDLEGHFEYLESQHKLPTRILLENGNEASIRGAHLREFTRLQSQYGFQAFVEHKGKIEPLHPEK